LFPKVAATVHHGGAGTTTAALRAGKPTIITPVFADQWDFSRMVRDLNVGVGFDKQFQKISWQELGDAICQCTQDESIIKNATELGEKLRIENGAKKAKELIEDFWEKYGEKGEFHNHFPGPTTKTTGRRYFLWLGGAVVVGALGWGVAKIVQPMVSTLRS